uniref:ADAMTS cysteine-rich domain-containing protein n=1 Tax=Ciona savignyi TaxID=51511 RepID=H2YT94_CIOSA
MSPVPPVLCAGLDVKYDSCNLNACPIAAQESWNSWGNWHPCPQSCGGALQIRMRGCASSLAQTVDPRRCQ